MTQGAGKPLAPQFNILQKGDLRMLKSRIEQAASLMKRFWSWVNMRRRNKVIAVLSLIAIVVGLVLFFKFVFPSLVAICVLVFALFGETIENAIVTRRQSALPKDTSVANIITEILTTEYAEAGIKIPTDVYSVYVAPSKESGEWIYHAKAKQSDDCKLDSDSLESYKSFINARARDIGAPIKVTDIHPRGKWFEYDIVVTGNVENYQSPSMIRQDRDF
jgi:hypothetical protein